MNRYVVRSLVAVLAFCIGVAVSSVPRRTQHRHWKYECARVLEVRKHSERAPWARKTPAPAISIDNASTDPLRLLYSKTSNSHNEFVRQTVELLIENTSRKEIASVLISYRSTWSYDGHGNEQGRQVDIYTRATTASPRTLESVSLDCDADESLVVWVAAVEFKDGSRWENPRHKIARYSL